MSALGTAIRSARQEKGLSQSGLAKITGFTHTYIAKIELGRQRGSLEALIKLAAALDLPMDLVGAEFGLNGDRPAPEFGPDDYQFSRLPPDVKAQLLKIGHILQVKSTE
jgi:transcriptional regulator with XRE-family HTH domain